MGEFYQFLQKFHSGWAYAVISIGLIFLFTLFYFFITKANRTTLLNKIGFYTTMAFHIQMLVGFVLYFVSPRTKDFSNIDMGDPVSRLYAIEHPLMMLAAIILITVANAKMKKSNQIKFPVIILVVLAMSCVFAMIPWEAWQA